MEDKKVCEKCGVLVSKFAYNRHLKSCNGDPKKFQGGNRKKFDFTGVCQYCGKLCKNSNSLRNHERLCKQNPKYTSLAGENNPHFGKKGSNQFIKARELGLPVPISKNKGKPGFSKGKKLSEETKRKISETQKNNYKNKSRWFIQGRNKRSFAENYFYDIFNSFNNAPENNFKVDRFWLDFAWVDKKIYVEIDGEQHYINNELVQRDKDRECILKNLGWVCIKRIRWSTYKKKDFLYKQKIINNIKILTDIGV